MYKTLGGYNWSDLFHPAVRNETIIQTTAAPIVESIYTESVSERTTTLDDDNILAAASDLKSSIQGLKAVRIAMSSSYIHK